MTGSRHLEGQKRRRRALYQHGAKPHVEARPSARGLKARPIARLIPQVLLIEFHAILPEKGTKLILERSVRVVFLLRVDVSSQRAQISRTNRKGTIPALPRECRERWRAALRPLRGRGLQLLDQRGDIAFARQPDRQMHMVGDATDAIALAAGIPRNGRKVRVQLRSERSIQHRPAILRAEDDVHKDEGKRQRHWRKYRPGLQPSPLTRHIPWGCAPCWYTVRLQRTPIRCSATQRTIHKCSTRS